MGYKCSICGSNEVDLLGEVCEICAIGQDPYAVNSMGNAPSSNRNRQILNTPSADDAGVPKTKHSNRKVLINGGQALNDQDPYGNNIISVNNTPSGVQVYSAGQVPQQLSSDTTVATQTVSTSSSNEPITAGIVKNMAVDKQERNFIYKLGRALFKGIPYTFDDAVTMFQVFPDYTGTALNAVGNACDQVVVYGTLTNGAICENNDVEVFGRRDSNNNIIAKTIRNKASGTIVSPTRTISPAVVWLLTLLSLPVAFFVIPVVAVGMILKPMFKQLFK